MRATAFPLCLSLCCAVLATACAQAKEPLQLAQLIVKFRPDSITCDAQGIARLASRTRLDLQWIRPMSGDACVISLRSREAAQALDRLQALPEVEWAQADAVMRPQAK